jgi:putative peptide zinc metalloprotease protein
MSASSFSSLWYRVAHLRPRLRNHAQIHRQRFRNHLWYVLQDHASGRFHRLSPSAYQLIGLMDGRRSLQKIWEVAGTRLGDELPTQDEVVHLLTQLHMTDVLVCDVPPDVVEISARGERLQRRALLQRIRNPLAIRFPIVDPDRFLTATLALVRPLFGGIGVALWICVVGVALVTAGIHWSELTNNITDRVLAASNIAILLLTYPFVKALHELGHGYAVKRWGGEVHEMGIMLLVFFPVPYVEASASSAFTSKWQRAAVGAAGIVVEMCLAAIALFVWINIEPGMARAVAFNVMLIAGVSTVLFNGNPLLRFDGYYVLTDLIEVPNLGTRANRYFMYLIQRYLFGVQSLPSPADTPSERNWLLAYGIASFLYRIFIMVAIILFVATQFFFIGVVLAIWAAAAMFLAPLVKGVWFLATSPRLQERRLRAVAASASVVALVLLLLLALPVPYATVANGVVWPPEEARLHAGTQGVISEILASPGSTVGKGEPLMRLEDLDLRAQLRALEAELEELDVRYSALRVSDLVKAKMVRERIDHVRSKRDLFDERTGQLLLRSPGNGEFVLPRAADLPGRFVHRGELLGYVMDLDAPTVRVIVTQADIDPVRRRTRSIEVRFADQVGAKIPARVMREVPASRDELPSMALSTVGGGEIVLDPGQTDRPKSIESLFQLDLGLLAPAGVKTIGGRVFVRFDHGREPLARRLYRQARRLFLSRFNI